MAQTAQTICTLAMQDAKCPGYATQAGECLNMVLSDLCQNFDVDQARGYYGFTFNPSLIASLPSFPTTFAPGGPYPLPADYLRADVNDVWFMDNSQPAGSLPHRLVNVDLAEFDQFIQQAGLASYPTCYATDLSLQYSAVPIMVVWPPPNGAYPVNIRYRRQMPDITNPASSSVVPWFPSSSYLRTKTAAMLMQITDDERWSAFNDAADEVLRRFLKLANDNSSRAKTVKMDNRRFGPSGPALPPTKIFWY